MDFGIAVILAQDGITNGAVYALLAMALVLVFSVTRIIFLAQGEFVGFGALTLAGLQSGHFPRLVWLLMALGLLSFCVDVVAGLQQRRHKPFPVARIGRRAIENIAYPAGMWVASMAVPWQGMPMAVQIVFVLMLTVPIGLSIYRLAYQPVAEASVLVLIIVSVAVHFATLCLGLLVFGPEGSRTDPFTDWVVSAGGVDVAGQSLVVIAVATGLIGLLYAFFERTLKGKALRATAVNRNGARLVGIGTVQAGRLAFALATGLGALAGILIGPMNTVQYDTGFVVALKGFVAAIIGGLASYPLAAAGALLVGLLESYSSFWHSAYKEVIVFTLILPVLAWRSLRSPHSDEE
ncbi:branched-chain amino acid ABC transporter permease [Piscinibacter gummiphilus]|uniref:ABC transporter permease n=1 Tax=Piscinibacter gummiphilus TaxID=946333 RepID=A0A1W6L5R1_9BURK|nr:branched-chain amino acid ABC transporter permease [Piscinibacter gummiphilus]ARN19635.1 ABC transporter permease [Piscinibacter gummiphilus]ATU64305.1 branched-chain amino acid ABC transporter permease [Piscinibacter gummiphilus]GLS93504.1 branched-chain amino acid ABC transporter permease [Piscinibacter gummiphilus]